VRYQLIPYLYTLFANASFYGYTVARPLFFEFPLDPVTYTIDTFDASLNSSSGTGQFLWGAGLLISPVLMSNPFSTSAYVYLPREEWYLLSDGSRQDNFNFSQPNTGANLYGNYFLLDFPFDTHLPLLVRGGYIIPMFSSNALSVADTVASASLSLVVAMSSRVDMNASAPSARVAHGSLYWDDGSSVVDTSLTASPLPANYAMFNVYMDRAGMGYWRLTIQRSPDSGSMTVATTITSIRVSPSIWFCLV
jgi:lysosomal alpha-glucosidase